MDRIFYLSSGMRLGPYEILAGLDHGGMSSIYKAKLDSGELRALKVLQSDGSEDAVDAIRWEADIGSILGKHENIVTIYELGQHDRWVYLSMDFVDGDDVESVIGAEKKLSLDVAVQIALDVAHGLDHMHSKRIVHGDVKPRNIILDHGKARIFDYGISYDMNRKLPQHPETIKGTPQFMSPEQSYGCEIDQRSDVYSLGATFYHMLCGEPPFETGTDHQIIRDVRTRIPAKLGLIAPSVPASIEDACKKALEKKPEDRFPNALAFAEAIELGMRNM